MADTELSRRARVSAKDISRKHFDGFGPIDKKLVKEFLHTPHNPELITKVWRTLLPDVDVPYCRWTEAEIAKPVPGMTGETYDPLMVPDIVAFHGPVGLARLAKRFYLVDDSNIERLMSVESYGIPNVFVKIEGSVDAPNLYTTEDALSAFFAATGTTGITEQVYILGALFTKRIRGAYFDQFGTISDIQGSHDVDRGATIRAWFEPDGRMKTASPHQPADMRQIYVGRRTMEVPHAA